MLRAGWSCPSQTGYQAGSEEAPLDGNCSQIEIRVSSSYCELVLQLCSWGPNCTSVYWLWFQIPKMSTAGFYVLLQVHEQAHPSRPLTKLHVSGEDLVRKHYDKLTGAFSFATGPEKGLCSMSAAFYRGCWQGSHTLPSSEGDEVQHDPARRTDSGGEENSCSLNCFQPWSMVASNQLLPWWSSGSCRNANQSYSRQSPRTLRVFSFSASAASLCWASLILEADVITAKG